MPKIQLHIGAPKTGTSFLQAMMAVNRDLLLQSGVLYPEALSDSKAAKGLISSGNGPDLGSIFQRIKSERSAPTYVYSREHYFKEIAELLGNNPGTPLRNLLGIDELDWDVELILLVRHPVQWAWSSWQQAVKRGGEFRDFEVWIRDWNYLSLARKLIDGASGHGWKVSVLNYSVHRPRLWTSFLEFIGCQEEVNWNSPPRTRVNRSLSSGELRIQLVANRIAGKVLSRHLADRFCNDAPNVKPAGPMLTRLGYINFLSRIEEDLAFLNRDIPSGERLEPEPFDPLWEIQHVDFQSSSHVVLHRESVEVLVEEMSELIAVTPKDGHR